MKAKEKKQQDLQNAKIIIANRQYLYKNWRDLPLTDILVCDEVHTANAKVSKEFIDSYPAKIKVGCSGTLPKDKLSLWDLQGMFGKVLYKYVHQFFNALFSYTVDLRKSLVDFN